MRSDPSPLRLPRLAAALGGRLPGPGRRIGLLGGLDMDFLSRLTPDEVFEKVYRFGKEYRNTARGYALGSGNSIPDFIPVGNYLAMIRAAQAIRLEET